MAKNDEMLFFKLLEAILTLFAAQNHVFFTIGKPLSVRNLTGTNKTSLEYFSLKATYFSFKMTPHMINLVKN